MSAAARWVVATALAVLATGLLGALSRAPVPWAEGEEAALRLTWRLRSAEVASCIRPTPEELERLPPHMRNPDACTGRMPAFSLTVQVDGETVHEEVVEGAGARGDRPIYVFQEIPVAPGARAVRVAFAAQDPGRVEGLRALHLDTLVTLAPRQVVLVTHEAGAGEALVVREPR